MPRNKETTIYAELLNMKVERVKIEQIYLDPNNPRLEIPGKEKILDSRIVEPNIQNEYMSQIKSKGIVDLTESISTSGFWIVDRIVLRPLVADKYVVVEGNRRVAALKTLKENHEKGIKTLAKQIIGGIEKFEALKYTGSNPDIAWIIQGFRHTPGIKSWERYPKAKFFADFEKASSKELQDIASLFGIKPAKELTHLIRSYYAFEQAKQDDEYGDMLTPDKFGHFDEIIMVKEGLKIWLGWDDTSRKFTKTDNLRKYLSWATSQEDVKPRIDISPTTRDTLAKLVQPEYKKLFDKFSNGELNLIQCANELHQEETKRMPIDITDIIKHLRDAEQVINTLPIPKLQSPKSKEERLQRVNLVEILRKMINTSRLQINNLTRK
ncbi:MAG TPA: ParB/Srx family N-terminal domain-containing protein [bacterium]